MRSLLPSLLLLFAFTASFIRTVPYCTVDGDAVLPDAEAAAKVAEVVADATTAAAAVAAWTIEEFMSSH